MNQSIVAFWIATVAGCVGHANAATLAAATVQKLDKAIEAEMRANNLPSVAVAAWIPGRGNYVVAKGQANLSMGEPRRVDDPFRIASITKTFIATAILQLVDQGKLSKTDRLSKWYPGFPNADLITVDDLLRMRSGIPDSADPTFIDEYYANPLMNLAADDMINRAAARPQEFTAPGGITRYTNVNFIILEQIVVKTTHRQIGTYLSDAIFKPLKMNRSSYPTGTSVPGPLRGYSLNAATGQLEDRTVLNPTPAGGAGAMISTVSDLRNYARALCRGTLLKPATQAARLQTAPLEGTARYGEGIATLGPFCGHNGTIFGFSSEMWYLPAKDAVIVINVNRLDKDDKSQSSGVFAAVARVLFPDLIH